MGTAENITTKEDKNKIQEVDMKDPGKSSLVIAKIMLSYLCLWPMNRKFIILFLRYLLLINMLLVSIPNIYYFLVNITDMGVMANTCTTLSTIIQTLTKTLLLSYHSHELSIILQTISTDFWSASIVDKSIEDSIKRGSRLVKLFLCIYLGAAFTSCWEFMGIHLVFGRRLLPLGVSLFFDWTKSPWFELFYVWQFLSCSFTIIHTIAGHDFFFNALIMNCISQFKLINSVLLTIGTGKDKIINKRIKSLPNYRYNNYRMDDNETYELVSKCVQHHILILNTCDKLQKIYGAMILLQFFLSATALCVSSFVLTQFDGYITKMISFATAHLVQFYFLCAVGTELIWHSASVSEGAYASAWSTCPSTRVRHALMLIILRAQRPQVISALGFANLDYTNFVNILRLSFSFHTLLSSLEE